MLAARREPIFDQGEHHAPAPAPPGHTSGHAEPRPTGFARFISALQIIGTVLGIPLGLASGYSIYHANFSVAASCQGLRGNIISMLDKSADASTLRMLVRRDVIAFEQSCGSVDPDAVAAFKTLLSRGRPAVPAVARSAVEKPHAEETREAKVAPKAESPHAVREPHRRAAVSDTRWLSAVREALVRHHKAAPMPQPAKPAETARLTLQPASIASIAQTPPVVRPALVAPPEQVTQPTQIIPAAPTIASVVMPTLAPATPALRAHPDHPVPPGLIPDVSAQTHGGGR